LLNIIFAAVCRRSLIFTPAVLFFSSKPISVRAEWQGTVMRVYAVELRYMKTYGFIPTS
jgi:hypothetical protein